MAQATRCPHCQTAFKVVRDQLLLREGWVRCGHCGEPFNALDHLIDLSPPDARSEPSQPAPAPPEQAHAETQMQTSTVPVIVGLRWDHIPADQPAYQGFLPLTAQAYDIKPAPQPQATPEPDTRHSEGNTQPDANPATAVAQGAWDVHQEPGLDIVPEATNAAAPENASDIAVIGPAVNQTQESEDAAPLSEFNLEQALNYHFNADDNPALAATTPAEAKAAAQEPTFVRQARRQARWSSTPVRLALGAFSLLLLLLLAGQAALLWRDNLAQQWPASRPWLQQLCHATTGCQLAAPRDLDALVIDSSALSPAASGLQLTVLLRNRHDRAVAWPALELTLTDTQGRIEQRKVLEPANYLPPMQAAASALRAGIAPGEQMQLQLHLAVSGAAPAGYKLALFYP
jgi:predicted Zn finger-like uncharacterized protein